MAVIGSGIILGDGVITPSLSIMSAWEGLEVITPRWSPYVPWLSIATLILLFGIQRFGTAGGFHLRPRDGRLVPGARSMGGHRLSTPRSSLRSTPCAPPLRPPFPRATLYVIGSVDLCITGCEALYADMGHFSRPAVRRAWFWIV